MASEPPSKSVIAFVDGQNLFHAAREAFGYSYPNYDILALSRAVCEKQGWNLKTVRFYTGIPEKTDDSFWNNFWSGKLAVMGRQGITVFSRSLRYRNQVVKLPDGSKHSFLVGEEKGIDVRIALDIIRLALHGAYDVALVFSQDQDLSEVADEIRLIASEKKRWIRIACAYPVSLTYKNKRGINNTEWIPMERALYEKCLDHRDYRPDKTT